VGERVCVYLVSLVCLLIVPGADESGDNTHKKKAFEQVRMRAVTAFRCVVQYT